MIRGRALAREDVNSPLVVLAEQFDGIAEKRCGDQFAVLRGAVAAPLPLPLLLLLMVWDCHRVRGISTKTSCFVIVEFRRSSKECRNGDDRK
jgi:hypothetical protein